MQSWQEACAAAQALLPKAPSGRAWLTSAALALATSVATAQPATPGPSGEPADPSASTPTEAQLAEAKRLFHEGNELRKAGDYERALGYYLKSRGIVESLPNTLNAAFCLDKLGRHDEALELYEALITTYRNELTPEHRKGIAPEMARLRGKVGSISIQANTEGAVIIDGRKRGALPLLAPIRVMPGKHVVHVLAEGYRKFQTSVAVQKGQSQIVVAELEQLSVSGGLRIEAKGLEGARLLIDGADVGELPWEGALAPGNHYYVVRGDQAGSAPARVVVVEGQTVLATPKVGPLGPELRIQVKPSSARLEIGDVPVGQGSWGGRLPLGAHEVTAREEGYRDQSKTLQVSKGATGDLRLQLAVDEDHPRWHTGESGSFFLDAFGGVAIAPTLGSQPEEICSDEARCASNDTALGFMVGGRGGYEFPIGLSIEVAGGYLTTSKSLTRSFTGSYTTPGSTAPVSYSLTDELRVGGPFAGAGLGYRLPFADVLELRGHVLVGAHFAFASDTISGTTTDGTETLPAVVQSGDSVSSANLFVMPELHFGVRFGGFGASLGLTAAVMALDGPALESGEVRVDGSCNATAPGIACAPAEAFVQGERAYGTHVVLIPSLSAGYIF